MLKKIGLSVALALIVPTLAFAKDFRTDFSSNFRYVVPHRHDTTSQAAERADGVLTVSNVPEVVQNRFLGHTFTHYAS